MSDQDGGPARGMTPEELREAVARAIREAPMRATQSGRAIDGEIPLTENELLRADAALRVVRAAMREPSEEMQFSGSAHTLGNVSVFLRVYRAAYAASPLREE